MVRSVHQASRDSAFTHDNEPISDQARLSMFAQRQQQDLKRFNHNHSDWERRPISLQEGGVNRRQLQSMNPTSTGFTTMDNNTGVWRNVEGDRLDDFGVDEDAELYDDDEVPLSELIRRKKFDSGSK